MRHASAWICLTGLYLGVVAQSYAQGQPQRFPKGVWLDAAAAADQGLRHVRGAPEGASRALAARGRTCVATDGAANSHLWFDIDDDYIHDANVPLRVIVEYLDQGTSNVGFELWYESTDRYAPEAGTSKRAIVLDAATGHRGGVLLRDTGVWKAVTFYLPDAKCAGTRENCDFRLVSRGWEGEPDLLVASVRVTRHALFIGPEPPAVAEEDGATAIYVFGYDATGAALPEGTRVTLAAERGTVDDEVALIEGIGQATYRSPGRVGTDTVTATCGELVAKCFVPVIPGRGQVVTAEVPLLGFEEEGDWSVYGAFDGEVQARRVEENPPEGFGCLALEYDIRGMKPREPNVMLVDVSTPIPGWCAGLAAWVRGDGNGHPLILRLQDGGSEVFAYPLGENGGGPWLRMSTDLRSPEAHWAGNNDGVPDLPLRLIAIQCTVTRPCAGRILFDDLIARTYVTREQAEQLGLEPMVGRD